MTKTITVIGNVGSGKTTLSKLLAEKLPAALINADPFESNPFLSHYAQDHERWSLATELSFAISRSEIIAAQLVKYQDTVKIIDSGLLMGIDVYAMNHKLSRTMIDPEITLFQKIIEKVVNPSDIYPDLVIICQCDTSTCLQRINVRGRGFEKSHSQQYLQNLEICLGILEKKLIRKGIPIINFNTTLDESNLGNKQYQSLIKEINKYV